MKHFKDVPAGLESLTIYQEVIQTPEVFTLLADIVQATYPRCLGPSGQHFVHRYLNALRQLPPDCSTDDIQALMLSMRKVFQGSDLDNTYHTSFRLENIATSIDQAGASRFTGTVVDIGADDNAFGHVLFRDHLRVTEVMGIDIMQAQTRFTADRLHFRVQTHTGALPVEDSYADTAVLRYVLHHIPGEDHRPMLCELRRILKPGGVAIIYENTYSFQRPPLEDRLSLHTRILSLKTAERIHLLLAALDTFSQGIKEKIGPFPYAFRSIEDWLEVFGDAGLAVDKILYLGMPLLDLHQAPLGIFILSNPVPSL